VRIVLVVDDEEYVAGMLRVMIEIEMAGENVTVAEAHTGQQAVDACATLTPQVMILDLMMPGMDGFAVLEAVGRTVPTLVLSARMDVGDAAERCLALGAQRVMSKPFSIATFLEAVRALLAAAP
jgi:DNA-binding response OmpR family regulator